MTIHIKVKDLTLRVPHFVQTGRSANSWLGTLLGASLDRPRRSFRTILEDVSFDISDGDRLALIGRNGAGKSTLLRALTGAYQPTSGVIDIDGRCQALLNISLGFNGEATVQENILLRGTAMGMHISRVRELTPRILDFSGLSEVANHRLHTLSSGQRMRLGFAISTSTEQDIMLLDEWLGAGDMQFIRKARARMNDQVMGSRVVVLATHNVEIARRVCNLGLILEKGKTVFFGGIIDALKEYKQLCRD